MFPNGKILKYTLAFCLLLFSSLAIANEIHGDIHERILKVSGEIKASPDNAYLFFKRAKLYYQHEDYVKSLKDLLKSDQLGNDSFEIEFQFSMTYLKLQDYNNSMLYAQKILDKQSTHVRALKLMAQNYYQIHEFEKSALAYQDVISNSVVKLPENYVDASLAWENLGNEKGIVEADKVIRQGISDLGNLIAFYNRLRELALNQEDYIKAIQVQKVIITIVPRKEFAYFKLSELYQLNNDETSALHCLTQSKTSINKLPQRNKNTSFIKELIENIKKTEILLRN